MFDITITGSFTASHCLRHYPERTHKHSWEVTVTVRATELDEIGLGVDFCVLQDKLEEIITPMNGSDLNSLEAFQTLNPSAENVARTIFERLAPQFETQRHKLYSVRVSEMENASATYYG